MNRGRSRKIFVTLQADHTLCKCRIVSGNKRSFEIRCTRRVLSFDIIYWSDSNIQRATIFLLIGIYVSGFHFAKILLVNT